MNQQQPQVSFGEGNIDAPATEEGEEEVQQHLEEEEEEEAESRDQTAVEEKSADGEKEDDHHMEVDPVSPATVFCVTLKQPNSNLIHKMSVPELCRNFRFRTLLSFSD